MKEKPQNLPDLQLLHPRGDRTVIYGSVQSGPGISAGWALWRGCTLSGLDGSPGLLGANGQIWWAVEALAGAL